MNIANRFEYKRCLKEPHRLFAPPLLDLRGDEVNNYYEY